MGARGTLAVWTSRLLAVHAVGVIIYWSMAASVVDCWPWLGWLGAAYPLLGYLFYRLKIVEIRESTAMEDASSGRGEYNHAANALAFSAVAFAAMFVALLHQPASCLAFSDWPRDTGDEGSFSGSGEDGVPDGRPVEPWFLHALRLIIVCSDFYAAVFLVRLKRAITMS